MYDGQETYAILEHEVFRLQSLERVRLMAALSRLADLGIDRSERRQRADSVEKQRVASAESRRRMTTRAPFLSGFAHLLRCRKDLG